MKKKIRIVPCRLFSNEYNKNYPKTASCFTAGNGKNFKDQYLCNFQKKSNLLNPKTYEIIHVPLY